MHLGNVDFSFSADESQLCHIKEQSKGIEYDFETVINHWVLEISYQIFKEINITQEMCR